MNEIILASASPRRRELIMRLGRKVTVLPQNLPEVSCAKTFASKVKQMAACKLGTLPSRFPNDFVVCADTIVCIDGRVIGKPADRREAEDTLRTLGGRWHKVYTGVVVAKDGKIRSFYDVSRVKLNKLSDARIKEYVDGGSPMDKAGAYGVQDEGIVEKYVGDYDNIMGLPIARLQRLLEEWER